MSHSSNHRPIAIYGALGANVAIAVAKLLVAKVSGSSAIFSEGIHSLADTGNEVLLLVGLHLSRRPPDARHVYGHGKDLYFWSLVVAIVLFALGGGMSLYEGVTQVLRPTVLRDPTWTFVVLAVAFMFEAVSLTIALRELKKAKPGESLWRAYRASRDPSVYMVVAEDSVALLGILTAFIAVTLAHLTGISRLDGVGSLTIGALLSVVAVLLAMESRTLLVGESASPALLEELRALANADAAVCRVGQIMTMRLGPDEILLNVDLEFRSDLTMPELRSAIQRIERAIRGAHAEVSRIFIEASSLAKASR
ncbi:MAG TPA: cation diffusion facilitator family transporter [Polyangiaceae bacterium]|nr:cation diffusion facilitator family transporter [Polyangiaceae bacterium]